MLQPLGGTQYGWDEMNLGAAWQITGGGYALVAQIDAGLYEEHPSLAPVRGNQLRRRKLYPRRLEGRWIDGRAGAASASIPSDLDEAKAMFIGAGACTPVDAYLPPARLGHGTHVAGLLGANGASGQGVQGHLQAMRHRGIPNGISGMQSASSRLPKSCQASTNNAADRAKAEAIDTGSAKPSA